MYKFEKLEVYQLALTYADTIYSLAEKLPRREEYNLQSQITRAATSIVLNIAEGSTSQSDSEQRRFLTMAPRSLMETVACQQLIERRNYLNAEELSKRYEFSQVLFGKLQAMRRSLKRQKTADRRQPPVGGPWSPDIPRSRYAVTVFGQPSSVRCQVNV